MKIIEHNEHSWDTKVNFIDEKNVFVGYDTSQTCCEYADWFISDKEENLIDGVEQYKIPDIEQYNFDSKYFETVNCGDKLDAGGMIRFKLVSEGKPNLYLHIFNSHNGYYGHGFEAKIGGQKWQEGTL